MPSRNGLSAGRTVIHTWHWETFLAHWKNRKKSNRTGLFMKCLSTEIRRLIKQREHPVCPRWCSWRHLISCSQPKMFYLFCTPNCEERMLKLFWPTISAVLVTSRVTLVGRTIISRRKKFRFTRILSWKENNMSICCTPLINWLTQQRYCTFFGSVLHHHAY